MKKLLLAYVLTSQANGAVIFDVRNETIIAGTPNNRIRLDLDGNGSRDWSIQAVLRSSIASFFEIDIIAPETTSFLYETGDFGMRFEGLKNSPIIGPESESTLLTFASPWQNSAPSDLAASIPLAGLNPQPGNFVGETAYLGFRFQGDEGIHYGYALFTNTSVNETTLVATAWESEPGKSIVAVPEPSSLAMIFLGIPFFFRRNRGHFRLGSNGT